MTPAVVSQAQTWISTVGSILEFLLIVRVVQLALFRIFPAFLVFLICDLSRDSLLRYLGFMSPSYTIAWSVSAPVLWIALVIAVFEIYQLFYRAVPASREVRWTLVIAAILASVTITLPVSVELIDHVSVLASWEEAVRTTNRFVFMAGSLILLTQTIFFARVGMPLPHNIRIHRFAFTLCLSADACIRFITAFQDPVVATEANLICSTLFCVSLVVWLLGFRSVNRGTDGWQPVVTEEIQTRS